MTNSKATTQWNLNNEWIYCQTLKSRIIGDICSFFYEQEKLSGLKVRLQGGV